MIKTRVVQRNWNFNFRPAPKKKRWLARRKVLRQEEEKTEQKDDDKEEGRGQAIEVEVNKVIKAIKKGLVITNIKF